MPFRIRHGTEADLDALVALDVLCFDERFRFSRAAMHRFTAGSNKVTLVAEDDRTGALAGFLIVTLHRKYYVGYVTTLDVAPEFRRRGLAAELMTEAEALAAADPVRWMELHVSVENAPARGLYEKLGYRVITQADDFYGRGLPALCLRKQLVRNASRSQRDIGLDDSPE